MRRFVFSQVVATLVTVAIFLGVFTILDVWQKSLDARVAAMSLTFIVVYAAIILFRMLAWVRDWDRPIDVAFSAAVVATIALMGWWGAIFAMLVILAWSLTVFIEGWKEAAAGNRRLFWYRFYVLPWAQFLVTWILLFGLVQL